MIKKTIHQLQRRLFDWSTGLCLRFHMPKLCQKIFDLCPKIEQEISDEADELMRKAELTMKIDKETSDHMLEEILRRIHEIDAAKDKNPKV